MSTNDVPGAVPANGDELAMGCWAEHEDGSLLFVESTENGRVIYSMFDLSRLPVVEYRDSMKERGFKKYFTFKPGAKGMKKIKWTWHDKTPFPWDRVIAAGARDGTRLASADDVISAAEQVAESRDLHGRPRESRDLDHLAEKIAPTIAKAVQKGVQKAIARLRP